jgi:hypothetical protein
MEKNDNELGINNNHAHQHHEHNQKNHIRHAGNPDYDHMNQSDHKMSHYVPLMLNY